MRYFSILLISFTAILLFNVKAKAQVTPTSLVEPSPEAYSLNKYGFNTLNKYNGISDISIPLHTIKFDDLSIPITLSYTMPGLNPKEEASWVGLGWTISATSAITRQINDQEDFSRQNIEYPQLYNGWDNGWIYTRPFKNVTHVGNPFDVSGEFIVEEETQFEIDHQDPGYSPDLQPDIFAVNLFGKSLKFLLNKKVEGSDIITTTCLNDLNHKITFDHSTQYFQIIDDKGYKFDFKLKAFSKQRGSVVNGERVISSWYLTLITSPAGEQISFFYDTRVKINSVKDVIESAALTYNVVQNTLGTSFNPSGSIVETYSETDEVYLTEIHNKNEQIVFRAEFDRLDLENISTTKAARLASIDIYFKLTQFDSSIKKSITFSTGYFNYSQYGTVSDKTKWLRLKLNSLNIQGELYSFEYNSPEALPHKETKSIDLWGYYNGKNHQKLYPYYVINYPPACNNCGTFSAGSKREADPTYSVVGVLNKIIYPTKGYTVYTYEGNEARFLDSEIYTWEDNPSNSPIGQYRNKIVGGLRIKRMVDYGFDHLETRVKEFSYLLSDNSNTSGLLSNYNLYFHQNRVHFIGTANNNFSGQPSLQPPVEWSFNQNFTWESTYPTVQNGFAEFEYIVVSSAPNSPQFNSAKGYHIGYSRVVERIIDTKSLENSQEIVSEYYNSPSAVTWYNFNPKALLDKGSADWNQAIGGTHEGDYANGIEGWALPGYIYNTENGSVLKETILSGEGLPLQETIYSYNIVKNGYVVGVRYLLGQAYDKSKTVYGQPIDTYQNFVHEIKMFQLSRKLVKNYSGSIVNESVIDYTYTQQWLNRSQSSTNSDLKTAKVTYYYPDDYSSFNSLIAKNIVSIPVRVEDRINESLLKANVTQLNDFGKPVSVFEFNGSQPSSYEHNPDELIPPGFYNVLSLSYYPNSNRVQEIIDIQGITKTYIYGYGSRYVVAEIVGATYQHVLSLYAIDQTKLDVGEDADGRIQELSNLRQALTAAGITVTTYTINPLVGMTTKTDANGVILNYAYDEYGRLKTIRDTQGRILKMYTYELGN